MPNTDFFLEKQAINFRDTLGLGDKDPIRLRSILAQLNVISIFKPLSISFSGMAIKVESQRSEISRFMLVNSLHSKGKQHFTVCHELYHLFIQKDFKTAACQTGKFNKKGDKEEYNADLFASYLLLPEHGVKGLIPDDELKKDKISLKTVLNIEQYFSCSRAALLYRLKELSIITSVKYDEYCENVKKSAVQYGFSTDLYGPGNENLVIGDYGILAKELYDQERISQSHYLGLLLDLGMNEQELEELFSGE